MSRLKPLGTQTQPLSGPWPAPPYWGEPCAVAYFCFRFIRMPIIAITAPETTRLHTHFKIPFSSPPIRTGRCPEKAQSAKYRAQRSGAPP